MPKTTKAVKAVKSHYAHETRKDTDLAALSSLRIEKSWPFIRAEVEAEIGGGKMTCVPYLEEAALYDALSVLLPHEDGLRPAGNLLDMLDLKRSDAACVEWLRSVELYDKGFKFPHESVKITLQDEQSSNKVRVIMLNFLRKTLPRDKSLVNKIYLKDAKALKTVHIITEVIQTKTVEFRANHGISSRIFHIGNPSPLVFSVEKFDVNDEGMLISQVPSLNKSNSVKWWKVNEKDQLYGTIEMCAAPA